MRRSSPRKTPTDAGAGLKVAQNRVFPVVLRIKKEIDFCFSSFYGDLQFDRQVCERVFTKWVDRGYRGPGELSVYIEMLATHLSVPTQQSIFRNLANDCISVVKKSRPKTSKGGFLSRYKFQIMINLVIVVALAVVFYLGKLTGG